MIFGKLLSGRLLYNARQLGVLISKLLIVLSLFFVLPYLQINPANAVAKTTPVLKVGFLYVGPINDWGWTHAQEEGRLYVQNALKDKVETSYVESIYESAEAERVIERMIAQGCKLIFATSYGYLEPVLRVSARHPDVTFMQLSRNGDKKNVGGYFFLNGESLYLAGVAAGRMTKTNILGFVGSHPVPSILQAINAFALGAQSVNPKARVKVVWTNTWIDPATEVEAAKGLIDSGIDILAFDQSDSLPIVKTAEKAGIKIIGCYFDTHEFAPKQWLTGGNLNWGPFYAKTCQQILDHTWKSGFYKCDLANGTVDIAAFGPSVPNAVRKEVLDLKEKIKTGQLVVFAGPLKDAQGKLRMQAGKKPDIEWISKMNFFVPGIDGNLPKMPEN